MKTGIRPMTYRDKAGVMEILRRAPEFKPSEVAVAEEVIDSYLNAPAGSGYHALVAEVGGEVVGYLCYGPTPLTEGTWDIYWEVVAGEWQGQGVGSALMAAAEEKITRGKGRLIIIETSSTPAYEKARRFYSGHGYELAARLLDFYSLGDDKLVLQKRPG